MKKHCSKPFNKFKLMKYFKMFISRRIKNGKNNDEIINAATKIMMAKKHLS